MTFARPSVLWLVLLVPPLVGWLLAHAARRRREGLAAFLGPGARPDPALERSRRVQGALWLGALALALVALAGPRWGQTTREARQESLDLLVALDLSDSMLAEDVAPSRLERAKLEIRRIVADRPGDRVGLVVFAGEAFLQCPLTTDRGAFRLFLDAAQPDLVPLQGTDVAAALRVAEAAFDEAAAGQPRPRAVVVVSDGEDHEGGAEAAADDLREGGAEVVAIGIGTDEGGTIPLRRRGAVVGTKTDREGEEVVTRYEPAALRAVAGRGDVFRIGARGGVAREVGRRLDRLDRTLLGQEEVEAASERFQWPLALALLLLALERAYALRAASRRPASRRTAVAP